jgi:hypothetical protein
VKHPALKELYNILKEKDWTEFCPEKTRQEMLDQWVDTWVVEVEQTQLVVDKKYLDSEHLDLVKYRLGQDLGNSLAEECVSFKSEDKRISASMVGIRRRGKK